MFALHGDIYALLRNAGHGNFPSTDKFHLLLLAIETLRPGLLVALDAARKYWPTSNSTTNYLLSITLSVFFRIVVVRDACGHDSSGAEQVPKHPSILTIAVGVKENTTIPLSQPGAPKANGNCIAATPNALDDEFAAGG
jgi:hypothetical protein